MKLFIAALLLFSVTCLASPSGPYWGFAQVRNVYSSTNVTTSAWVQLVASTAHEANAIEVFDSSGQTLQVGIGGSGSETAVFTIPPGGNGFIRFNIPLGSRVSVKALSGTANSGELDISFYN